MKNTTEWLASKIRSLLLIVIGAVPIMLAAIYHFPMDITGAILPIFIGGCTLVGGK